MFLLISVSRFWPKHDCCNAIVLRIQQLRMFAFVQLMLSVSLLLPKAHLSCRLLRPGLLWQQQDGFTLCVSRVVTH